MKMRKNILSAVFIGFSIVMVGLNAWGTPIVNLTLENSDVTVDSTFNVLVSASEVEVDDLLSFGFDLDFDSSEFSFIGATVGTGFDDNSALFDNTDVSGSVFPAVGGDDFLLATLSFTALTAGDGFSLGIFSDTSTNVEGLELNSAGFIDMTKSIEINVGSAISPVPEPSTVILVFIGLVSMAGFRRLNNRVV